MKWSYDRTAKVIFVLVAIFSIVLISISIWTLADPILKQFLYPNFYNPNYDKPYFEGRLFIIVSAIGITLGIAIFVVMCMGFIVSLDNVWTRRVVACGSGILLILNIAGIVSLCINDDTMNRYKILRVLEEKIKYYHYSEESMEMMDAIQRKFQCCGMYGIHDYPISQSSVLGIPDTCPEPPIPQRGCIDLILIYTTRRWEIFVSIYIILTLLQVAAMSSVCFLDYKGFKRASTTEEES